MYFINYLCILVFDIEIKIIYVTYNLKVFMTKWFLCVYVFILPYFTVCDNFFFKNNCKIMYKLFKVIMHYTL